MHRFGAQDGDEIWVTGTIGDGALGLAVAQGRLVDPTGFLLDRYRLPQPRVGLALAGIASAGDGCVGRSGSGPWPYLPSERAGGGACLPGQVPLSDAARAAGPDWLVTCLTGGDDYELLLAVPPARSDALRRAAGRAGIAVTQVGHFHSGPPEVMVRQANGEPLALTREGWSHF